jgi:hypothetical protein
MNIRLRKTGIAQNHEFAKPNTIKDTQGGIFMKKMMYLLSALLLLAVAASAQELTPTAKQLWAAGWDNFNEPLDVNGSNVTWSVANTRKLTVTFTISKATPNKLYQVGAHIFCTTFPPTFGQFPANGAGGGNCYTMTRQGVTQSVVGIEMGVVTTDIHGTGSFKVVVGPIASGTYNLEFTVRNGAGCNLIGGGTGSVCSVDFQSPGPFGTGTTITIP